ncbi:hypothetical protein HON52_00150 [Candidatus Uhrbacteria bacterium]|nr:hypothetical protein [Candidatus Uhrbacteria bacterium]
MSSYRVKSLRQMFTRITALLVMLLGISMGFGVTFNGPQDAQAVSPPNTVSYQGRVLDSNGVPVTDATASMKFEIYSAVTGGTCLWSNSSATCDSDTPASTTARTVTLTDGLFTARMGDTGDASPWAAIGDSIFADNASTFLQIYIGGETLTPRKAVDSVPYALNAESLDGLSSADFNLDQVYSNGSDTILNVDATDLEFSLDGAGLDLIVDLQSTGDFILQDAGTEFLNINDSRQIQYTYNGTTAPAIALLADSLTTATAMSWSLDALTTGIGIDVGSTSSALTSGKLIRADHSATYTSGTTAYTGMGLDIVRDLTSDGGSTTVNVSGPFVSILGASTTANGGTLNETGSLLAITQNNTAATGSVLLIDSNTATAPAFDIDSEATTASAAVITADVLTAGNILDLVGGNFTNDAGMALSIDVTETTDTADIFNIQTNFGSTDNNVFRIEADGEVFSDIGFTAGAFSTNYMDGEIQTTGDMLLDIDGGDLTFDQATIIGDGGDALTINSSGTLTIDDTTFASTGALEVLSGGSGNLTLNSGSGLVSTASTDDFSVGASVLASAFSIDESANLMRLGDGAGTSADFNMYSSAGDTGSISYTTADRWSFQGGNIEHFAAPDYGASPGVTYAFDTSGTVSAGASGGAGTYQAVGSHVRLVSDVSEGGGGELHEPIGFLSEVVNTSSSGQIEEMYAIKGVSENQSTNGTAVGNRVVGVLGQGTNDAAATTVGNVIGVHGQVIPLNGVITTAKGVLGNVTAGSGTATTTMGGDFSSNTEGTTRYGVRGQASAGTNNYAGYFYGSATHIESTSTPTTANVATGAGDLFVWDAFEINGAGTSSSQVLVVDASTSTFMASFVNGGDNDNRQGISIQACSTASGSTPTTACDYIEFRDATGTPIGAIEGDGSGGVTAASAGSDYAELFDGTYADFVRGDVISLTSSGEAVVANDPSGVIGVLSVNPNTLGNWTDNWQDDGGYVPVALLGQVPVNVNTDGGSISIGDYVALSSVNGVAMKATGVGYTIGRALEAHSSGTGLIQVFIQPGWHGVGIISDDDGDVAISSALTMLGDTDSTIGMSMFTDVTDSSDYKLSILNDDEDEVAFVNNDGDLAIAGRLYPSDRGTLQTDTYIYYDGSSGAGGDFMRTNASGWGAGSYDFAEMFPSAQTLAPGEVVVFANDDEHVMRSTGITYDQRIAGIISTQPGFLAGENIEGHVPVALSGRVPTYVSGENGDISIGDPLTTSSKDGYAMKATEAGPILGYAMEAFQGEVGSVSVFVRPSYYDGGPVDEAPLADSLISNLANASTLDLSGTVNFNTGQIINIAAITGVGQQWSIAQDGTITTNGAVVQVVRSYQNEDVETYATFSRQQTVELSGTANLKDGAAAVNFEFEDALFNDIIAQGVSYRVFLTADQPTGPLYAVNRDNEGFSIRESAIDEVRSTATVDWMVIAYLKDHAPEETDDEQPEEEEEIDEEDSQSEQLDGTDSEVDDSDDAAEAVDTDEAEDEDNDDEQEEIVDSVEDIDETTDEEEVEEIVEDEQEEEIVEEAVEEELIEEDVVEEEVVSEEEEESDVQVDDVQDEVTEVAQDDVDADTVDDEQEIADTSSELEGDIDDETV